MESLQETMKLGGVPITFGYYYEYLIEHFLLYIIKNLFIPYGMKILHGIKFYSFTVVGTTVKLKSVKFYYYIAKILSCFDNRKI